MSYRGNRHSSPNPVRGNRGGQRGQGSRGRGRGGSRVGSGTWSPFGEPSDDHHQPQNQSSPSTSRGGGGQAHRSGFSSPRGYPSRKKKFQPKPAALPHGGLGFHSLKSMIDSSSLSPSLRGQGPRRGRGQSDPRLLVPVKFVKATALTDKSLEKPIDEISKHNCVPIPSKDEEQTFSSESRSPVRFFNQELAVEVKNTQPSPPTRRASGPIKTAFDPSDQTFQLEMEEITEEAANRWQSQLASLAKVDDEPTKAAIASKTQDYQLEMEKMTSEASEHWQSQFPGLVAFSLAPNSRQARDHSLRQTLSSESLKPIQHDDDNDPINQSTQDEKSEIPASQPIAEVTLAVSDAGSAEQRSEILQSIAGDLISASLAVVSLNDHLTVEGSRISTFAAAYSTAEPSLLASSADKTGKNSEILPSVAAHPTAAPRIGASSIDHGSEDSLERRPSGPALNSQVANSMVDHPTDESSPMQSIKQDAQSKLVQQATATHPSGVLVTPTSIDDDSTLSNTAESSAPEPQSALPPAPEAAPSPVFFIDSEGDRNILSSSSFSQQNVDARSRDEDTDEEEDEQIVFVPNIVLPSCNLPTDVSHLSRTISDPVEWMPASSANVPRESCSATKSPRPKVTAPKNSKKAMKAAARRRKALRKRNTRHAAKGSVGNFTGLDYRCLFTARDISDQSDIDWGDTDVQPENAPAQPPKVATLTRRARKRAWKQKEEMEILAQYMMHTAMSEDESSEEDEDQELDPTRKNSNVKSGGNDRFLQTFLAGMQAQGHQTTIDELEEQAQEQSDDEHLDQGGWNTDRSSSLNEQIEALDIDLFEENLEEDSDGDDDEEAADHFSRKGKSAQVTVGGSLFVSSTDVDPVSEDDMIGNDDGWGQLNGDPCISNKTTADCGSGSELASPPTRRSTRQAKTKMKAHWEALHKGNVWKGDSDFEKDPLTMETMAPDSDSESESLESDSDDSPDLPALTISGSARNKKGKGKQRKSEPFSASDDELIDFIEDIQGKWAADRARKADRKRERAEARRLNPPKTKKQRKKASRRDGFDGSTEPDLDWLNSRIKEFIRSPDRCSYALPPLAKKTRARIHLLANVYGLKSHSLGGGSTRHPVLERTHRTTLLNVDKKKVKGILFGQNFSRYHQQYDDGDLKIRHKSKGAARHAESQQFTSATRLKKTREGMLVGDGVEHLGEDNIGFKLLAKMGWSMGQSIGSPNNQSALQQPLMAVMKSTKGGLGLSSRRFGY